MKKKIFWVLLFGFLIRLIALNQSLWLDEAVTANVVSNLSYSEIITKFSPTDFHPPFFYLVEKFWTNIFGYSEIALRFPSVIFLLLTGWIVYLIGKKMKDANVGLFAAILFLFNPLIIYYSQEARQYMMVTFLLTTAFYFLNRSIRNNLYFRDLFLANLFIFLSLITFYGSIFFIFAIYIWLLIKKEFKLLFLLLPGFILAGLLVFPLFIEQFANSKIALNDVKNWSLVLGQANIKNLLLIPIKFSIGRISFEPKILYWFLSGLWTTILFSFALRPKLHLRGVTFLAVFVGTLLLGLVASIFTPMLQYFRFIYLIPIFAILLVLGTKSNWQRFIILGGFLIFSLIYLLNTVFHREDWKGLVKDLKTKTIYMIPSSSDAVKYYDKTIEIKDLKAIESLELENEITVIPYTSEIHGVKYAEMLRVKGYELEGEKSYRELKVEKWQYK